MEDEGGKRDSLQSATSRGLHSLLTRKGDEHAFSILYLAAGIFCLYAAYGHGDNFCTDDPASADQNGFLGGILANMDGLDKAAAAQPRPQHLAALDPSALSEMKHRSLSQRSSIMGLEKGYQQRRHLLGADARAFR